MCCQLGIFRPYIYTQSAQKKEKYHKGRIHEPAACIFRHTMQACCKVFLGENTLLKRTHRILYQAEEILNLHLYFV